MAAIDVGTLMMRLGVDTGQLKTAEAQVKAFGTTAAQSMTVASMAAKAFAQVFAGLSIGTFFNRAIRSATEYQTKLIDMGRVTKISFEQIDARIRSMDASLGNATQLMEGYYQVISAGVTNPVRAQEVLTDAAKLGKAAHIDQAETVKALTKLMQGYGGELKNTSEAADALITIERLGQTTVAELVPVIGNIANMASFTTVNLNEMGGALALITQTAGSTRQAVTQLQMVLKSIDKPNKLMKEAFESIGTTPMKFVKDNGFVAFLKQVQEFGKNNPDIITGLVGGRLEGMLGFAALQKKNFTALEHMIEEMEKKTGSFASAWNQYLKGMGATWDTFKNNVKNFLIDFGLNLLPTVNSGLKTVNDNFSTILRTISVLVEFWVANKAVFLVFQLLSGKGSGAGAAAEGIAQAAKNAKLASNSMGAFKSILGGVTSAVNSLLVALSGPKGLAFALLAVWELNRSLNSEMEKSKENTGKTLLGARGLTKDLQSVLSTTGTGGGLLKDLGKVVPGWESKRGDAEDEAIWRERNANAWREKNLELEPYPDMTTVYDKYMESMAKKIELLYQKTDEYKEEIERLTPVTKELAMTRLNKWFEEQYNELGVITPELAKLYELQKKQILGPSPLEKTSEGLMSVIKTMKELAGFASTAMKNLGMKPEEASKLFSEGVLSKANEVADDLVNTFNNPYLRQSFAQALENMGKQGGNAFLEQIGKAVGGGVNKFEQFKTQMEQYQKDLEAYNEAKRAMEEKVAAGEAYLTGIWGEKQTYAVQTGMRYAEPVKDSYEEHFNAPVFEYQTLTPPTKPEEPKDTVEATAKKLMESLPEGLKKIDVDSLFKPIESAMNNLVPAGEEAGSETGNAFGNKLEIGAMSAIERIKAAIASIPTTIDLSLSPDSVKGISKKLAAELAKAGRE